MKDSEIKESSKCICIIKLKPFKISNIFYLFFYIKLIHEINIHHKIFLKNNI